jgi:hypothetical protein
LKLGKGKVERRTYVSTAGLASKITVFQESTSAEEASESTTATYNVEGSTKPIVYLAAIPNLKTSANDDLILVKEDGEIQCLGGELKLKWTSPSSTISKNSATPEVSSHRVDFSVLTDAHTASKGLLKDRPDIFITAFNEPVTADGFNPSILVIITSPNDTTPPLARSLQVIALPRESESKLVGKIQSVQVLLSEQLPWLHSKRPGKYTEIQYDLHAATGLIYELAGRNLIIHEMAEGLPKFKSQLRIDNISSFLRLSNTSLMVSTSETVDVYNPAYQSIQASVNLDNIFEEAASRKRKLEDDEATSARKPCKLVSYSLKYNVVHAIMGSNLVAFQIEAQKDVSSRRRALGLLIDSIGCGVKNSRTSGGKLRELPLSSLKSYIPGSKCGRDNSASNSARKEKFSQMDRCVAEKDVEGFEAVMAKGLGISRETSEPTTNGEDKLLPEGEGNTNGILPEQNDNIETSDGKYIPSWIWPANRSKYPQVDPRWVEYALSRIFSWTKRQPTGEELDTATDGESRLLIEFFPHNVINWLIETGNMNKASIETALKHDHHGSGLRTIPAGQLVSSLVAVDPGMTSLLALVANSYLDAAELVHAIRLLMQSLGMFGDASLEPKLLAHKEAYVNGDLEAEIEMEEAEADAALQLAEYHLGDESSTRGQALSLALAKLHSCPSAAVVKALQSTLSSSEIVSLIYLLRFELARGAWTSRYLDANQLEQNDDEMGTPNTTIVVVTSLLNSCIDAIGSGGWLTGDATLVNGDHYESEELISSLKLEVSAALEGIEEATYLKGLTAEMVRYGEAVQEAMPAPVKKRKTGSSVKGGKGRKTRPFILPTTPKDGGLLPFGLKADQLPSLLRVGAGGEIERRTARDIGRLKSRKVGKYSVERIVI